MTTKYTLTPAQLSAQLDDDLAELKREAEAYDAGAHAAAGAMAARIVTMLHDDQKARNPAVSRATRAGRKPAYMPDLSQWGEIKHPHLHGPVCILAAGLIGAVGFVPMLDKTAGADSARLIAFDIWWNAPVMRDAIGNEFSRGTIVRTMRDKEISHADGSLPAAYGAVMYQGMFSVEQHADVQLADDRIFRVIVRHIAHEVLRALDSTYPVKLLDTKGCLLAPQVLLEICHVAADGSIGNRIADHGTVPIVVHMTADPTIAETWDRHTASFKAPEGLSEMPDDAAARQQMTCRLQFLNANPVELKGCRAAYTRDQRSGALLVRCVIGGPAH